MNCASHPHVAMICPACLGANRSDAKAAASRANAKRPRARHHQDRWYIARALKVTIATVTNGDTRIHDPKVYKLNGWLYCAPSGRPNPSFEWDGYRDFEGRRIWYREYPQP